VDFRVAGPYPWQAWSLLPFSIRWTIIFLEKFEKICNFDGLKDFNG